jgi:lysophospholipase L1-like esterase
MYIKKFINFFLKFLLITFLSLSLFLIIDFTFGRILIDKYIDQIKDNPYYLKKQRVRHSFYHHTLAPLIDYRKTGWGPTSYRLCTNYHGFKSKCGTLGSDNYDIGFIGDSFTEGLGVRHEETFVGIIENKKKLNVANMGVSSYSPKIYLSKIHHFIGRGMKFKHVVVFMDISDLIDDSNSYISKNDLKVRDKKIGKRIENTLKIWFPMFDYLTFNLTNNNRYRASDSIFTRVNIYTDLNQTKDKKLKEIYSKMNLRSAWTYSKTNQIKGYDLPIDVAIKEQVETMNQLYELLKKNNIKLSIVVYPWPQTILYDKSENLMKTTWENFCKNKCANFINTFPLFMNDDDDDDDDEKSKKNLIIKKYYQLGDIHFNPDGHKLIADYFIKNFKF